MIYQVKFTEDEIEDVARSLVDEIGDVNIILFKGELGSGKTTLIKSMLKEIGVKDNITSPTFSVVNQYRISEILINHFDLYRLKSLKELDVIGFEEYLESGAVCFIEWPEIAMSRIVDNYKEIYIKFIDEKTREIILK
tara:strand:- start:9705 stop:10118 length:414 start_codon:yes stop_codon:yes gene_type:complete